MDLRKGKSITQARGNPQVLQASQASTSASDAERTCPHEFVRNTVLKWRVRLESSRPECFVSAPESARGKTFHLANLPGDGE